MKVLYGGLGKAVGSVDGAFLFEEEGNPVGQIFDKAVYSVESGAPIGNFINDVLSDKDNNPLAVSDDPHLSLLKPLTPSMGMLIDRIKPSGTDVRWYEPKRLKKPWSDFILTTTLKNFGQN